MFGVPKLLGHWEGSTSVVHFSLLLEIQVKSKKDIANFSARDADRPPQVSFKIRQKNGCRWILICKAELYYVYQMFEEIVEILI